MSRWISGEVENGGKERRKEGMEVETVRADCEGE